MISTMANDSARLIDAKTFMEPLAALGETIAQKVYREGGQYLNGPDYVSHDIFMMVRQALATYETLFYLNADERRNNDCYWKDKYGVVAAPVVRSMIDCLYNITTILENPAEQGPSYRKSGLKKRLLDIEEDQATYAGKPEWDQFNAEQKRALDFLIRRSGFTEDEVRKARTWITLGTYVLQGKPGEATPHQRFLRTFTHMSWRQYSALSHASLDGYIGELPAGAYFIIDTLPHDQRPEVEKMYKHFLTRHVGRAAIVLLSIITELQAYFRFEGADINNRILTMWNILKQLFEGRELYDQRYHALMTEKGVAPKD